MHLPALPYKQLAASLALAVPMLLASRSGADTVPVRAPLVRVAAAQTATAGLGAMFGAISVEKV